MKKYIIIYQKQVGGEVFQVEKFSQYDSIITQTAKEVAEENSIILVGIYKELDV